MDAIGDLKPIRFLTNIRFCAEEVDAGGTSNLHSEFTHEQETPRCLGDSQRAEREAEVVLRASPSALWMAAGSVCTGPPRCRCYCGSAAGEKKNGDVNRKSDA